MINNFLGLNKTLQEWAADPDKNAGLHILIGSCAIFIIACICKLNQRNGAANTYEETLISIDRDQTHTSIPVSP